MDHNRRLEYDAIMDTVLTRLTIILLEDKMMHSADRRNQLIHHFQHLVASIHKIQNHFNPSVAPSAMETGISNDDN